MSDGVDYLLTPFFIWGNIGGAGISAFPMSSRVVEKVGLEANKQNHLLYYALGANVSGQIASVIAGGLLLHFLL